MLNSNLVRRSAVAAAILSLSVGMVACTGVTTPTPTVSSVSLGASPTSVVVGNSSTVTATVTGTNNPSSKVTFSVTSGASFVTLSNTTDTTVSVKGVAAGTATIKACSTVDTTKCASVNVVVTPAFTIQSFSFRPTGTVDSATGNPVPALPAGYIADNGAAYGAKAGSLSYGWVKTSDKSPLNASLNTRARVAGTTDLQKTFIHMHCPASADATKCLPDVDVSWEIAVPNGSYKVTASVGDGEFTDSVHGVTAEGVTVVAPFNPVTAGVNFQTGTANVVNVTDGKLTISQGGTGVSNTKLNYVIVAPN